MLTLLRSMSLGARPLLRALATHDEAIRSTYLIRGAYEGTEKIPHELYDMTTSALPEPEAMYVHEV